MMLADQGFTGGCCDRHFEARISLPIPRDDSTARGEIFPRQFSRSTLIILFDRAYRSSVARPRGLDAGGIS